MSTFEAEAMRHKVAQAEQRQREEWAKADAEKARQEEERRQRRTETRRFWIQTVLTAVAALASLLGVVLQLLS